jgi:hypothetical protein
MPYVKTIKYLEKLKDTLNTAFVGGPFEEEATTILKNLEELLPYYKKVSRVFKELKLGYLSYAIDSDTPLSKLSNGYFIIVEGITIFLVEENMEYLRLKRKKGKLLYLNSNGEVHKII